MFAGLSTLLTGIMFTHHTLIFTLIIQRFSTLIHIKIVFVFRSYFAFFSYKWFSCFCVLVYFMFFHQHPSCRELCRRHQQMSVLSQYLMKIEMKMMVFLHFPKNAVKFRIFFLWYFKNEKNSLVSCFLLKLFFKSWKQKKFLWKKNKN